MCQPIELATGQQGPEAIAVDTTDIYWTNKTGGTVMKAPLLGGGMVTTLVAGQTNPSGIGVNVTHVYWLNQFVTDGRVSRVPIAGGPPLALATMATRPFARYRSPAVSPRSCTAGHPARSTLPWTRCTSTSRARKKAR